MTRARILADYVAGGTTAAEFDYLDGVTSNVQTQLDRLPYQSVPHIIPDVLYPAWSGLLDNHTGYTFTDSGNTGHTITPSGNIHHSGATEKIGSTSINFDGTGDYLSVADHADFDISGQFTIECWVNFRTKANYDGIITFDGTGSADFVLGFGSDNKLHLFSHAGNATSVVNSGDTINLNQWYHVAVSRDGSNNTRFYLDGVHKTVSTSYTAGHTTTSGGVKVGRYYTADDEKYFDGFLDELRVSNTARYTGTSSFTPSTSAFSSDSNTKLLIHSDNGGNVGAYGTAQSDGKKYYYTDIKGSKPIKDARIGSHFGSQRHKFKSIQLLEQETATHGTNVYSVDGREWIRITGTDVRAYNDDNGLRIGQGSGTSFIEVIGYFGDANYSCDNHTNERTIVTSVDGGSTYSNTSFDTSSPGPLHARYVDEGSLVNLDLPTNHSTSLGIHTLKVTWPSGEYPTCFAVELIAQDTSNRSKIQIPAQNVVSYGKKFAIPATAQHYDPFNGFTSGSSVTAYVDTATSLGVEAWKNGSTYYRPYNGGRVVKWVDSSGTIKTSVNMMPPNARSIGNSSSLTNATAKANASVANDTYFPTFEAGTVDHSLAEVAKTFHFREFGNGAANSAGGALTSATYADASMLGNAADAIAYVMDDGLTSLTGTAPYVHPNYNGTLLSTYGSGNYINLTFIGTGLTLDAKKFASSGVREKYTIAQNLPYGTHVLRSEITTSANSIWTLDGVTIKTNTDSLYGGFEFMSIHQPKIPPIPEDAVVIADYMLCADWVAIGDAETGYISKGARRIHGSRDILYNKDSGSNNLVFAHSPNDTNGSGNFGFSITAGSSSPASVDLPVFSNKFAVITEQPDNGGYAMSFGGSSSTITKLDNSLNNDLDAFVGPSSTTNLGVNKMELTLPGGFVFSGYDAHGVVHSSSHYQTFETPYLHELVGGDRNMEQNNLIVTPDGKTWDEVTRDVSYIGSCVVQCNTDTATEWAEIVIFDAWRGRDEGRIYYNKEFAIGYDKLICLRDGQYVIQSTNRTSGSGNAFLNWYHYHDGTADKTHYGMSATDAQQIESTCTLQVRRGDYLQLKGEYGNEDHPYNQTSIIRLS